MVYGYMRIDDSTDLTALHGVEEGGWVGRGGCYQRWQDIQNKIYDRRASATLALGGRRASCKLRRNSNNKMKSTLRNKRNDNVAKWSYLAQQQQQENGGGGAVAERGQVADGCKVFLIVCATKMKLDLSIFRSQIWLMCCRCDWRLLGGFVAGKKGEGLQGGRTHAPVSRVVIRCSDLYCIA